ncbi:hypothetical protein RUMHYD_02530 [Blautia hydrogenotrophica DSM 10507]|uniref:Uncharacterized protein n=1 Tax=Blautia hydrogenotrophica (strain DSM 10507 / JCM 14656 / S5a33) TaxID=476272 RepID=C0CNT1_BLAHS|nr:hypothetical protein RUMHYD_02530 [Blautia hydrogenotrophica DSM 10507]
MVFRRWAITNRVFAQISPAECNEQWIFAVSHRLTESFHLFPPPAFDTYLGSSLSLVLGEKLFKAVLSAFFITLKTFLPDIFDSR